MNNWVALVVAVLGGGTIVGMAQLLADRQERRADVDMIEATTTKTMVESADSLVQRLEGYIQRLERDIELLRLANTKLHQENRSLRSEITDLATQVHRLGRKVDGMDPPRMM